MNKESGCVKDGGFIPFSSSLFTEEEAPDLRKLNEPFGGYTYLLKSSQLDSDKSVERTTFSQPLHIDKEIFVLSQVGLEPPTLGFELITSKIGGECSTCIATKSSC